MCTLLLQVPIRVTGATVFVDPYEEVDEKVSGSGVVIGSWLGQAVVSIADGRGREEGEGGKGGTGIS